jgi:type IV pilus assembly protein PilB
VDPMETTRSAPGAAEAPAPAPDEELSPVERLLREEGSVTAAQIERARKIARHLHHRRTVAEILIEMGQLARAEHDRVVRLHRAELDLGEILRDDGVLTANGLAAYRAAKARDPLAPERALLVDPGLVTEEQFLRAVAERHEIPYVEPEAGLVELALLSRISFPYLVRHHVMPLRIGDGALSAILADPLDAQLLGELERIFDVPVRACCATRERIAAALQELERLKDGGARPGESLTYRDLREEGPDAGNGEGAVAILDYLLLRAIRLRASDLHLEPLQKRLRVRVRIDGAMTHLTDLPADFAPQLISRVKVLAGADIAERRSHQDGRISVRLEGREVDIRVSAYVSVYGETIVMRLLDRQRGLVPLEDHGFQPGVLATLRDVVLRTSSGLVLVTGPTGSGKTTTLYSFIDYVNDPTVKTITCEDPVEYVLEGVTQCSVTPKTSFADSLRAIVRQDPDIIVVGEVRDPVTAALAVEAALTGHKVFSTYHTEDSVGAVVRLAEMGVEPFLVSSTVSCIVAQRLVRRVCEQCRRPAEPTREELRFLGLERTDLKGASLVQGEGCAACGGTGYRGRAGIHEVLMPNDEFKDAVLRRACTRELREIARRIPGYTTLQEDGLIKATSGLTTLAEIVSNVPRDTDARKPAALTKAGDKR